MVTVHEQARLGAGAEEVWKLVGDFIGFIQALIANMDDAHVVVEGEGVGMVRKVTVGEDVAIERLEAYDQEDWRTSYSMPVTGPFPMTDYFSTIQLTPATGGGCEIDWTGTFEPDGVSDDVAAEAVRNVYTQAIAMLQGRFGA
ncbi:SRPBCC family protein [Nonomuraea sp. NPDC049784]|uniref:SRPBCC family protein n=1 Tax=Nonomuraea sp. NPDC049784 TaxID=3154361 RepID=UPI0033E89C50